MTAALTSSRERFRQRIARMDPVPERDPNIDKGARRSRRLLLMILGPLAIFLTWEVITRSVVAYLADTTPEIAIRLRSTNSTALLNMAEDMIRLDPVLSGDP